ncbi:uncharacterized protein LOC102801309 [Saccoglossus kowalevskii]
MSKRVTARYARNKKGSHTSLTCSDIDEGIDRLPRYAHNICRKMDHKTLVSLKKNCDVLTSEQLEMIHNSNDFINALQEEGFLWDDNIEFLCELLRRANRMKTIKQLRSFQFKIRKDKKVQAAKRVDRLHKNIAMKEVKITVLETNLREKDATIAEKDATIAEKDATIADLQAENQSLKDKLQSAEEEDVHYS